MNNKELRKSIRRILKENLENSDWVNASDAQKAAMQDIDSEDEFEHLGTNRFEKDFDVEDFLYDLEAQKNMSEPSVKRLEKQIGQLKKLLIILNNLEIPIIKTRSNILRKKTKQIHLFLMLILS